VSNAISWRIERHAGDRAELRALFEEAEDSATQLDGYIDAGLVLVAVVGDRIVGHLQLVDTSDPKQREIKNMAVDEEYRKRGIGQALIHEAVALAHAEERSTIVVATATADIDNLRFYQRAGFRMRSIDRDAFVPATGYPAGLVSDGIRVRDRVWLDREPQER
jgi:ribosomal protein S18 acetylase RimI-like enzyme